MRIIFVLPMKAVYSTIRSLILLSRAPTSLHGVLAVPDSLWHTQATGELHSSNSHSLVVARQHPWEP